MKVEKGALKDEKKKLEYLIFNLIKVGDGNKDRLKRIRQIYDE
jgi:hypothetical protein